MVANSMKLEVDFYFEIISIVLYILNAPVTARIN